MKEKSTAIHYKLEAWKTKSFSLWIPYLVSLSAVALHNREVAQIRHEQLAQIAKQSRIVCLKIAGALLVQWNHSTTIGQSLSMIRLLELDQGEA
ncbi:hypothetical protein V6N12_050486 [Hibiscus sabdariffa]|uniref:Uncharacterized protein n=1 Tax=Hibiscus sabdariffa TaxID=183260 RepID=A0ABR2GCP6_9ROSI